LGGKSPSRVQDAREWLAELPGFSGCGGWIRHAREFKSAGAREGVEKGEPMSLSGVTLSRHILEQERCYPAFAGQLSILVNQIAFAAKILTREISRAALVGKLGLVGERNATGDSQKKLDVFSNETVIEAFADTGLVSAIVTEELDDVRLVPGGENADYLLCVDPLDGSSNTDINGSLGTIFGVLPRKKGVAANSSENFTRQGTEQVMAGYVMYSTSTILVYTIGNGVHGFTLDRDLGEFFCSHENIRCPRQGKTYSANLAHYPEWEPNLQKYVDSLTEARANGGHPLSLRYTGALVADFHRSLIDGGIYFYPPDTGHETGKLRLMYECSPLGFIAEQAGGAASTGKKRILDIQADSIHHRVPLAIGSAEDVALYEKFLRDGKG
jgi:fructose-1,6-bisphosphatase I